jgi:hypothetical protein
MPCRLLAISSSLARMRAFFRAASVQSVALARDDGAQDLLAGFTDHVGDDVGQLEVHLGQAFCMCCT